MMQRATTPLWNPRRTVSSTSFRDDDSAHEKALTSNKIQKKQCICRSEGDSDRHSTPTDRIEGSAKLHLHIGRRPKSTFQRCGSTVCAKESCSHGQRHLQMILKTPHHDSAVETC